MGLPHASLGLSQSSICNDAAQRRAFTARRLPSACTARAQQGGHGCKRARIQDAVQRGCHPAADPCVDLRGRPPEHAGGNLSTLTRMCAVWASKHLEVRQLLLCVSWNICFLAAFC